jgi:hypothetical protein
VLVAGRHDDAELRSGLDRTLALVRRLHGDQTRIFDSRHEARCALQNGGRNFPGVISGHVNLSDCRSALKLLTLPTNKGTGMSERSSYASAPKPDTPAYLRKHAEVPRGGVGLARKAPRFNVSFAIGTKTENHENYLATHKSNDCSLNAAEPRPLGRPARLIVLFRRFEIGSNKMLDVPCNPDGTSIETPPAAMGYVFVRRLLRRPVPPVRAGRVCRDIAKAEPSR